SSPQRFSASASLDIPFMSYPWRRRAVPRNILRSDARGKNEHGAHAAARWPSQSGDGHTWPRPCRSRRGQGARRAVDQTAGLARLEAIAEWLALWQGRERPRVDHPLVVVFAGNHGVVAQGVAAYPQAVTKQMVANFQTGGAAINQLCKTFNLGLKVFALALDDPTGDITERPALNESDCAAAIAYGMEALEGSPDLLCVGEMGIGNTTIAAAVCHGLYGGRPEDWVGPGTGVDSQGLSRKTQAVR